jgi:hypothetical protein
MAPILLSPEADEFKANVVVILSDGRSTNYKVAVPVNVMGTLDKWNRATAKTDQFYRNPLTGFAL